MNESKQNKTNKKIKNQGNCMKNTYRHRDIGKHRNATKVLESIANKQKTCMIRKRQKEKGKEENNGQTKHYDTKKNPPKIPLSLFFKYGD